jgi:hypothetical protein
VMELDELWHFLQKKEQAVDLASGIPSFLSMGGLHSDAGRLSIAQQRRPCRAI